MVRNPSMVERDHGTGRCRDNDHDELLDVYDPRASLATDAHRVCQCIPILQLRDQEASLSLYGSTAEPEYQPVTVRLVDFQ